MEHIVENLLRTALEQAQTKGKLPHFEVVDYCLERPQDANNGDWSSTLALKSARLAHMAPRSIAEELLRFLPQDPAVKKVEVAGPGFINFYLTQQASSLVIADIRSLGENFGRSNLGAGRKVQVEFISANPVGPLHIGHGRWAALGDSLVRILEHAGYEVEREYYINDHGAQMETFAASLYVRSCQLLDIVAAQAVSLEEACGFLLEDRLAALDDPETLHPETHPYADAFAAELGANSYGGDYIIELAAELAVFAGDVVSTLSGDDLKVYLREEGYRAMLERIKQTCAAIRCSFDVWFSERSLYVPDAQGKTAVDRALKALDEMGYLYRDEGGALWFKSTQFGDDKDRVLIKTNGEYTYFASDVAYHYNKFSRVDHVIDIWGADHHGYISRVRAACEAFGHGQGFEVLLGQLVNLLRDGEPVRMSKRRGTMISLDELLDEVGADAARYTLISKSSNQMIDFDIEKVKRQDNSNPVYYVQYAHARMCSILRKAAHLSTEEAEGLGMDKISSSVVGSEYDTSLLCDPSEQALIRALSDFSSLIEGCAKDRAPFRLTHYAEDLAAKYHYFYTCCRVLPLYDGSLDNELSRARLALTDAVRIVLALSLKLIGVSAPTYM